jgi:acyl carrier protein
MSNLDIYNQVYIENFKVNSDQLETLVYRSFSGWDSVGHMMLISALEEAFNIEVSHEDIIAFSSYKTGKEILNRYHVII